MAKRKYRSEIAQTVHEGVRGMHRLGLVYGAIDMRRTPDGRYVFLEINPAGQWLFVEHFSGQPITSTLARLLHDKDSQGRPWRHQQKTAMVNSPGAEQ